MVEALLIPEASSRRGGAPYEFRPNREDEKFLGFHILHENNWHSHTLEEMIPRDSQILALVIPAADFDHVSL